MSRTLLSTSEKLSRSRILGVTLNVNAYIQEHHHQMETSRTTAICCKDPLSTPSQAKASRS